MARINKQALFPILSVVALVVFLWGKHVTSLPPDGEEGTSKKGVAIIKGPNLDEQREQMLSSAVQAASRAVSESISNHSSFTGINRRTNSISSFQENNLTPEEEQVFNGTVRPPPVPPDWKGEPLPENAGWRWYSPTNRLDSVRLYRGEPTSADPSKRSPYVVVTKNGELIDRKGKPTGTYLKD